MPPPSRRSRVLAPLNTAKRSDQVADRLEQAILAGDFPIGSRLPPERELAERLGIGRPAVREAIRIIEHRGFVEVRHGVGTLVTGITSRPVAEACRRVLARAADPVRQLTEARCAFEIEIAALAACNAKRSDLEALDAALTRFAAATEAAARASEDLAFHRALAVASGNQLLPLLLQPIEELLHEDRIAGVQRLSTELVLQHHRAILAAVRAGDAAAAAAAMRRHLDAVGRGPRAGR